MTPTNTPEPPSGRRSDSATEGAPAPKSLKAALAAAEASPRSELPALPRSKAHDVIEGTIISQR